MGFSLAQEAYVFLATALCGFCIGVVYDLMRSVRSFSKPSASLTDVHDIIFWTLASVIMFFTIHHINAGKMRWYEFLGAFLGAVLYFLAFSKIFRYLLCKTVEIFSKIFAFFCKILLTPLLFAYNIIYKGIVFVFAPIFKLIMRFLRKFKLKFKTAAKRTKVTLLKK